MSFMGWNQRFLAGGRTSVMESTAVQMIQVDRLLQDSIFLLQEGSPGSAQVKNKLTVSYAVFQENKVGEIRIFRVKKQYH